MLWYMDDWYCSHLEQEPYCSMSILPRVTTSRKVRRAVNRLLPKGRRHRGDVCVA